MLTLSCAILCFAAAADAPVVATSDYHFDGTISRKVLENYLRRSITMMDLLTGVGNPDDNIRMLKNIDAKFAGRSMYVWGSEDQLERKLATARTLVPRLREACPDIVIQGAVFEVVTPAVGTIAIPDFVFEAFGLAKDARNFRYEAMLFPGGKFRNQWGPNAAVPDIRQAETKLWFYYLAAKYIDLGCEALHFGQEALVGEEDKNYDNWWELLSHVRKYAKVHARRHMVLCDAHTPRGGPRHGENLLFDFHAFPLRIEDVPDKPQEGRLRIGYIDSFYGRSQGGIAPSGWRCEHLPYLVEFDNWGSSGDKEGQRAGDGWTWGYDEICWYAHQPETYRNTWLKYALDWLRENDPNAFLEMPGSRCLAASVDRPDSTKLAWYAANRKSPACPDGFNQEDTIKALWNQKATK